MQNDGSAYTRTMDEVGINANAILLKLITDKEARLRYGMKKRAEMIAAVQRGEEPTGYRAEWLKETVRAVFRLMASQAAMFNTVHPRDRISTNDFIDVLNTAIGKLLKASGA